MEFLGIAFDMNDAFIIAAFIAMFMGLFDHLWALILDIWDWLIPFRVITEYEQAVVLRWGVWTRTVGPGLRWHWPFGIEEIVEDTVVRRAAYGDVQSCDSKDGIQVNISPIVSVWFPSTAFETCATWICMLWSRTRLMETIH